MHMNVLIQNFSNIYMLCMLYFDVLIICSYTFIIDNYITSYSTVLLPNRVRYETNSSYFSYLIDALAAKSS